MEASLPESTASGLVLAVDAGGTKTAAWLAESMSDGSHRILGRGRSTSGNPLSVGFDEATSAIAEAVAQARREANLPTATILRAVLSIAGALDPGLRDQFIEWARAANLAQQVAVVPDVLPVLAAGTPKCCGVALISGTGSSAFARSADGQTSLCGGWGFLLGDEGSGYAIGRASLRGALDDEESGRPTRPLSTELLQFLNARSARELTKIIHASPSPRMTLASIAPLIVRAADAADPFAAAIVDEAAHDLATLAARAARAVGLADAPFALALTGGVLVSSQRLRNQLQQELRALGLICETKIVDEPLAGCLRLAAPQFADVAVNWK